MIMGKAQKTIKLLYPKDGPNNRAWSDTVQLSLARLLDNIYCTIYMISLYTDAFSKCLDKRMSYCIKRKG